jgi:predicted enzyme related to lactoylglutathione lyase
MAQNPVGWFEIYVQDMNRARAFYESVLGIQLTDLPFPEMQMSAFPMDMASSGSSGALVCAPGQPSGGNSVLLYFSCDDCAVEAARAAAAGGSVFREKMSIGEYGFCALIKDTEGNLFGLHSRR